MKLIILTKHSERCASVHFDDASVDPIFCTEFTKLDLFDLFHATDLFLDGDFRMWKLNDLFLGLCLQASSIPRRPPYKTQQEKIPESSSGREGLGSRGISSSVIFKSPMSCCYTLPVSLPVCLVFFFRWIGKTDSLLHKARDVLTAYGTWG